MTAHLATDLVDDVLARLERFVLARHPRLDADKAAIDDARALSVAYTEHRRIDTDAAASAAYLAHFGPRAVVAVARALASLPATGPAAVRGAHVVDVGAGSGASALPWLAAGARRVTLIEQSARAVTLAGDLLRACYPDAVVDTVRADARAASAVPGATHVQAAFVVGEWNEDDVEADAVRAWLTRLAPNATTTVLVDAGDHPRARRLQALRDAWVTDDDLTVFGPCPHRDACPAFVRARDWCHDVVDKRLPAHLAGFARAVGRDDAQMSLSWLTWARGLPRADSADAVVVIGEPLRDKGRVRLPVCGPGGLRFVQALKRNRDAFAALSSLPRGTRLPVMAHDGDTAHVDDAATLGPSTTN
jgi:ribosomal protein RSM22 (predicted rRNA methylase)